jgi:Concanavalin A-like lectin/glucanases superfamily
VRATPEGVGFRSVVGLGLACVACSGCENDVSVQLLPGDNQALTQADARADSGCTTCVLSFSGPYDRVEIASSPLLDVPQDFAIEAWVFVRSYAGGHGVLNRWNPGEEDIELTFGVPEYLPFAELPSNDLVPSHVLASWGFVKPDFWISTIAQKQPTAGAWHHLATSYGGGSLRLYVDGTRAGSADSTERIANAQASLYIGATSRSERTFDTTRGSYWWAPIDGYITEVRISSTNRYAADFVPERRLASDASTIALWHLDDGKGDIAQDSGPNHLNGAIVGPQWVTAPSR